MQALYLKINQIQPWITVDTIITFNKQLNNIDSYLTCFDILMLYIIFGSNNKLMAAKIVVVKKHSFYKINNCPFNGPNRIVWDNI